MAAAAEIDLAYRESVLRQLAVAVVAVKIALVPLILDPLAFSVYSQPKILFSQATSYVLVGILAAFGLRFWRAMFVWSPLHIAVLALLGSYVLAACFALDHRVALVGALGRGLGLLALVDNVILYVAVVALVRTRTDLVWLGASVVFTTAVLVGYAGLQLLGLDPILRPSDPERLRTSATTGNPTVLAQYLGTVSMGAAALAAAARSLPLRLMAAAMASAGVIGALTTGSRSVLIGIVIGAPIVLGVLILSAASASRRLTIGLAATGAALVFGVIVGLTPVADRLAPLFRSSLSLESVRSLDTSTAERLEIYRVALAQIAERPVLGVGPDNYAVGFSRHRAQASAEVLSSQRPQTSTHSWVLKVATDAGLVGLSAYVSLVVMALWLATRMHGNSASIVAATGLVAFLGIGALTVNHVATDWLPWLAVATISVSARTFQSAEDPLRRGRASGRRLRPARSSMRLPGIAAILFALALAALRLVPLQAAHAAEAGQRLRLAGAHDAAIVVGQTATSLDPNDPEYWNQLGMSRAVAGAWGDAILDFRRAAHLATHDWRYLVNLSSMQLNVGSRGDRDELRAALVSAARAADLDPYVDEVQYILALASRANGRHDDAVRASELWLKLVGARMDGVIQTNGVQIFEAAALSYVALERFSDAERWVRLALGIVSEGTELRLLLAEVLGEQARPTEALEQIDIVLAAEPTHASGLALKKKILGSGR